MHPATEQIIETTRERFQLTDFYLESYDFLQQEEGQIHLSMTWIPKGLATTDDLNPNGTVVIAVDIESRKLTEIIFVGKENRLPAELFPQVDNMESMIEWIEEQTQLEYGRQFKLVNETKESIVFHAAVDNIRLFPGGTITISFNEEGLLASFYVHGMFADESQIHWEPFNLVEEVIYPLAKQHCKLIEVPDESTAAWKPYYVISSFLVSNQHPDSIIYFNQAENNLSYTPLDTILTWEEPSAESFEKKEIDLKHVFTEEEVFQKKITLDNNRPIKNETIEKMKTEIRDMLRKEFPNDSGRWRLTSVKRDRGYLLARLDPAAPTPKVLYPSLKLLVDPETLQVDNYMDTGALLEAFEFLADAEAVKVDTEAAAERLCGHIEVEPVYVYNQQKKMYQLYGKVTGGAYAVDAVTGEVSTIDE